jgi:hypothetical protein
LYGAVRFAGVAVGPPAFALALEAGRGVMLGAAAACAAVVLALSWWLISPNKLLVEAGTGDARRKQRNLRPAEPEPQPEG